MATASPEFDAQYELADRYRAAGTKVLMGGLHVTALPDEARQHADAIVIGENIDAERENGRAGPDAATAGAKRMLAPVVVGVLKLV